MDNDKNNFIQQDSPDGALKHALQGKDFLQSSEWREFQEASGKKVFTISGDNFHANIFEHVLPIVGKYFYIPRGPILIGQETKIREQLEKLIKLAKDNQAGWVRIDPATDEILHQIRGITINNITKAPHDMQPREVLVIDIKGGESDLLARMKQKTRYNVKLAQKKGVKIEIASMEQKERYINDFLRLTNVTARRNNIVTHPEKHYRIMLQSIPDNILKLYVARHQGKTIAANIVAFFGGTATYLHGASDDAYKNVMAPYLLQWRQILDAASSGCEKYDFGGVKTEISDQGTVISKKGSWEGITKFKFGFSPDTKPIVYPGSYDIIINPWKYWAYRAIQKAKSLI